MTVKFTAVIFVPTGGLLLTKVYRHPSGLDFEISQAIALSMINSAHLHYNEIWHVCEAIKGYFVVLARNCPSSTLDYIVKQLRKSNREKAFSRLIKECLGYVRSASSIMIFFFKKISGVYCFLREDSFGSSRSSPERTGTNA